MLAHNGTVLLRAGANLQRPLASSSSGRRAGTFGAHDTAARILEQTRLGISGYDPDEADMRGVFMARGPGT